MTLFLFLLMIVGGGGPNLPLAWAFWIVMLLALIGGFLWPRGLPYYHRYIGYHFLGWLAIFFLGWAEFGLPGIGR